MRERKVMNSYPYKGVTCRGCWALGTACGTCEKCIETKPANGLPTASSGTPMPNIKLPQQHQAPFITCEAGNGEYVVKVKCHSLQQAHQIHGMLIESLSDNGIIL